MVTWTPAERAALERLMARWREVRERVRQETRATTTDIADDAQYHS
jgi:hypothetical protein